MKATKPYTIVWPLTPEAAENINKTFDILFQQDQQLDDTSGVLPVTQGGTGLGSFTKGDLLYAFTPTSIRGLHDIATGNVLLSGGVGVAPSYGKVALSGGTTHVTGTLPVTNGGTGLATVAQGDILYGSAADTLSRLAKDTNATRYLSNTGASNNPAWAQVSLTQGVTGTLPVTNGGTGLATFNQGDIIYASAANTLTALAKNTTATRYLSNTGASNNPAWAQVDLTNGVTGTLPATSGGTGFASYAVGDLLYASTTTALSKLPAVAAGNALISGGVNTAPSWGKIANAHITDGTIAEAKLSDDSLLARVASTETISAAWTFSATPIFQLGFVVEGVSPTTTFNETDQGSDGKRWRMRANGGIFLVQTTDDAVTASVDAWQITRSGNQPIETTFLTSLRLPNQLTPSALSSGNNNNYAPTNFDRTFLLRVEADAGGSTLTGLAGGASGRVVLIMNLLNTLTISMENVNSSVGNRFTAKTGITSITLLFSQVAGFIFDQTLNRWLLIFQAP